MTRPSDHRIAEAWKAFEVAATKLQQMFADTSTASWQERMEQGKEVTRLWYRWRELFLASEVGSDGDVLEMPIA